MFNFVASDAMVTTIIQVVKNRILFSCISFTRLHYSFSVFYRAKLNFYLPTYGNPSSDTVHTYIHTIMSRTIVRQFQQLLRSTLKPKTLYYRLLLLLLFVVAIVIFHIVNEIWESQLIAANGTMTYMTPT